VVFGDLFSGFRKFGTFIVFWLVVVGISVVCGIVMIIPIIGWIAVIVFAAWLGTTWLYVLPLIADRGLTFGEAARASSQMVKGVGWWKTFGTIIVLGVAFMVIGIVISLIGRASQPLSSLLLIVFEVVAGPFAICYVATMYLQAGGEAAGVPAGGYAAPMAPPPTGGYVVPPTGGYGMSPAAQAYQPAAPPPVAPPPVVPPAVAAGATAATAAASSAVASADDDVWKAAADPLAAAAPPSAPPQAAASPPAEHEHTAVTTVSPGVDAASGTLEKHCSQCGALIEGSDEFCQSCALEVSGGEPAATPPEPPAAEAPAAPAPAVDVPPAPEPPAPPAPPALGAS